MRSRPVDWSVVGLVGDPTPGWAEEVAAWAAQLRTRSERLWARSDVIDGVRGSLGASVWSGLAAEVFCERLAGLTDAARVASARHREAAEAALVWCAALADTQASADRALWEAEEAQAELLSAQASLSMLTADHAAAMQVLACALDPGAARRRVEEAELEQYYAGLRVEDARQRLEAAQAQAHQARDAYDTAEGVFIRDLEATLQGGLPAVFQTQMADLGSVVTSLGRIDRAGSPTVQAVELMNLLTRLTPQETGRLLTENPELAQRYWDAPPPADQLASWWAALPSLVREQWCQAAPLIIGNLPGLDADTRLHANAIQLRRDLYDPRITPDSPRGRALQDILDALGVRKFSGPWLDYETLARQQDPPRGLLSYHLHHDPPLAAVAIGETTAEASGKVTWMVPGMASGLGEPGRLKGWADAAVNVYDEQNAIENSPHMVVAWIGYDPPPAPPDDAVLRGDRARAGAGRLSRELDGQGTASRVLGGNPDPYTAVIGHSYGTTVVSNALTDPALTHNVQSVVLLASAGVENTIGNAKALAVDGGGHHVYVSESSHDGVAGLGRNGSGRQDPRDASFCAREFSSEGDPTQRLEPTDGHDTLGYGTDNGPWWGPHATADHGYLDPDTEALHNTAAATLGLDGKINGGAAAPGTGKNR